MQAIASLFDLLISAIVHGLSVLFWLGMAIGLVCMVVALVAAGVAFPSGQAEMLQTHPSEDLLVSAPMMPVTAAC